MFGIGGTELAIILIFGFLVLGPDKLPQIARWIGKAVRSFKDAQAKVTDVVQAEVYEPMKDVIDPIRQDFDSIKKPIEDMAKPLTDMVAPLQEIGQSIKNPFASVVDGVTKPKSGEEQPTVDAAANSVAEPVVSPAAASVIPAPYRGTGQAPAGIQSEQSEPVVGAGTSARPAESKDVTKESKEATNSQPTMSLKVPQLKKTVSKSTKTVKSTQKERIK